MGYICAPHMYRTKNLLNSFTLDINFESSVTLVIQLSFGYGNLIHDLFGFFSFFSFPLSVRPSHSADLYCYVCKWVRNLVYLQHLKNELQYEAKGFINPVCSQLWLKKYRSIYYKICVCNIYKYYFLLMYLFIMLPWHVSWWLKKMEVYTLIMLD